MNVETLLIYRLTVIDCARLAYMKSSVEAKIPYEDELVEVSECSEIVKKLIIHCFSRERDHDRIIMYAILDIYCMKAL